MWILQCVIILPGFTVAPRARWPCGSKKREEFFIFVREREMNKQPDRLPADDECHCDRCEGNRAAPDLMPLIGARMVLCRSRTRVPLPMI